MAACGSHGATNHAELGNITVGMEKVVFQGSREKIAHLYIYQSLDLQKT